MGLTHVQVTVRNPADPARSWEGTFLVDTGAIDSLVPRDRLEQIGLRPRGHRTYELADGREAVMGIAVAELEFMGDIVGATIVVGEDDTEPLLGVTALESLGIEVDPTNQRLRKLPSIRLKAVRDVAVAGNLRSPMTEIGPPVEPTPRDRTLSAVQGLTGARRVLEQAGFMGERLEQIAGAVSESLIRADRIEESLRYYESQNEEFGRGLRRQEGTIAWLAVGLSMFLEPSGSLAALGQAAAFKKGADIALELAKAVTGRDETALVRSLRPLVVLYLVGTEKERRGLEKRFGQPFLDRLEETCESRGDLLALLSGCNCDAATLDSLMELAGFYKKMSFYEGWQLMQRMRAEGEVPVRAGML